ncbi:hypothetical protein [Jannaschia pohangensis]|uniref:Ig-like domain-containing protein n=1 Tax=Jannaschia pohangensis TaxID=390807 RepID=A0A1I3RTA0_9RHOB|nr:hypothetical protein [Jannaschia pohangensis]SFJ49558.1 hypothetical protein SAMN04488095_2888 [Jannaschia pohangensis]
MFKTPLRAPMAMPKWLAAVTVVACAATASAQQADTASTADPTPVAIILDQRDGAAPVNPQAWEEALGQSRAEVLTVVPVTDPNAAQTAAQAATDVGTPENTVILQTFNVPAANSSAFDPIRQQIDANVLEQNAQMGWQVALNLPMCVLYERPPSGDEPAPTALLAVMDEVYAQVFCYRMAIAYYASGRDESGARIAPVYIDAQTIAMQETMPPIAFHSAYLAHKDRRDDRGRYLARDSNVYAPGEEIFLRGYLENVARGLPGTMEMTFEFDLHMEVRDDADEVLGRVKLHTYTAPSTLLYPVDETQFWNSITAGVNLGDPGSYTLTFIATDKMRAGEPSAEVSFDVVVDADAVPTGRVMPTE